MYQEPLSAVQPIAMVAWALPWTVAATLPTASTSLLLLDYLDGSWPWSIPSLCPELQQPQLPAGSSGVLSCLGTACRGNPQLRNPVSLSSQHTHSILQGMVWSNNSQSEPVHHIPRQRHSRRTFTFTVPKLMCLWQLDTNPRSSSLFQVLDQRLPYRQNKSTVLANKNRSSTYFSFSSPDICQLCKVYGKLCNAYVRYSRDQYQHNLIKHLNRKNVLCIIASLWISTITEPQISYLNSFE